MSLYPSWIRHEFEHNKEKVSRAFSFFNEANSEKLENRFEYFCDHIGGVKGLKELGIKNIDEKELANQVDGNIANDPLATIEGIIETIYKESM
jgi:hypothetical protein